ncbi:phosphate propanoyltransferase [Mucisphaera calidilacus]|uniref:Phosphate propanoyltransferase n=1 Tax=Mucisphaera calidilacus TaxID=2527982 RepID=A0A518BYH8_9BACT|nr:phosphate propanoyltransferase [Mucisphaera calidilacus]QDU72018.1 Phosphate propanoyltransferase [Mucisphaera calidilacus]
MPQLANMDRAQVEQLVREALRDRWSSGNLPSQQATAGENPLVVNVSARHVHVTQQDLETLFGPGSKLTVLKNLYQDGEFASEQTVNLIGPRNRMIPNVRILGPTRDYTQVELSYTDGIYLGIELPLRISGNHEGTPGGVLVGPHGAVNLAAGVVRAQRHVHMSPKDAERYNVVDGEKMKLRIDGPCGLTLDNVVVRVNPKVKLEVHIDTDEGNACHLATATHMELTKA